jgi:hypothetical protein
MLVSQPLLLNYSCNTCSLNLACSFNLACLFEVGQEAYCTICKFQCTRFNLQGSTYKNSMNKVLQTRFYDTRTPFKRRSRYSPISSQGRVLVKQASVAAYLRRFPVKFFPAICSTWVNEKKFYQRATYEDNFSTFPQPRILFWFTSSGFLDPSCWSIGSYVPFSTRKPHAKAVP